MLQNFAVIAVRNSTPTSKPPSTCHGAAILFNPRTLSTNPHTFETTLPFPFLSSWVRGFMAHIVCIKPMMAGELTAAADESGCQPGWFLSGVRGDYNDLGLADGGHGVLWRGEILPTTDRRPVAATDCACIGGRYILALW